MSDEYFVTIEETVSETFPIHAESPEEAAKIAAGKYSRGEIVLKPGNLLETKLMVSGENGERMVDWREV